MIIAIDGPAGSGKSSTARAVADRLDFRHLDSGAFYRALTFAALIEGIPVDEWESLDTKALNRLDVAAEPAGKGFRMLVRGGDATHAIRSAQVNANVSAMARVPAVREWLLDTLRETAGRTDLVADGRDIGTVVFPDAELKVFLVADPAVRAERRLRQDGRPVDADAIAAETERLAERDRSDSERATAPLRPADDAVHLDTSELSFEQQVSEIVRLGLERGAARTDRGLPHE
jgi:CMP/dCMP kinase